MTSPVPAQVRATDVFSAAKRSDVMRRVKGRDTAPELAVRRLLWSLGARYRLHRADLPGKPDIVLPGRRLALFVHGCFWHGHECRRGARLPKANRDYWRAKIAGNRARDAAAAAGLVQRGWRVEVVWECELKNWAGLRERLERLLDPSRVGGGVLSCSAASHAVEEAPMSTDFPDRADPAAAREKALSRWDSEGGALRGGPAEGAGDSPPAPPLPKLSNAELVQLRVRVIALENLVIALLAEGTDRQRQIAREMASYIAPRAGFTPHPLTIQASSRMEDIVDRARRFRG